MKKHLVIPEGASPVQRNLAYLINQEYDGNVKRAAAASGVQYTQLWRIVHGWTRQPGVAILQRVAAHFHCRVDDLLAPPPGAKQ